MRVVVLSPEGLHPDETRAVPAMIEAGLSRYHVRKPGWSQTQLESHLRQWSPAVRMRCVVHGPPAIVESCVVLGCHWADHEDTPVYPGAGFTSRSCHDLDGLQQALGHYSAVFFSPVFASLSKPGYGPTGDLAVVASILQSRNERWRRTEVIALGGITPERIAQCAAWGFDGLAALGAIWQAASPLAAFRAFQSRVEVADAA